MLKTMKFNTNMKLKRLISTCVAACGLVLAAGATGTVDVLGTVYSVDTLFYS